MKNIKKSLSMMVLLAASSIGYADFGADGRVQGCWRNDIQACKRDLPIPILKEENAQENQRQAIIDAETDYNNAITIYANPSANQHGTKMYTQMDKMISDVSNHLSEGSFAPATRQEAIKALMKMYIAGSHANQKGDFKARMVDGVAEFVGEPGMAYIMMYGNAFILGMGKLINMVKFENPQLEQELEKMLIEEGINSINQTRVIISLEGDPLTNNVKNSSRTTVTLNSSSEKN